MSIQTQGNHDKSGRLIQPAEYPDGRTKQSFADETDINKILQRAQQSGTLSHLQEYSGVYGDFADFDFFDATLKLSHGREVFDALPSELRTEFNQSPAAFFKYVNDPANADDLRKKLPALAKPGKQNIDVSGKTAPEDPPAKTPATPEIAPTPTPAPVPKPGTQPLAAPPFPPVS